MEQYIKRFHYYHADGSAFGATLETPISAIVPVQAPISLPVVGGYASSKVENFNYEGIFSFKSASTNVAGTVSTKNGGWVTMVTSAVQGLNILDIVTADQVVTKIMTEHPRDPRDGYDPKVSFVGSRIENLRIGGDTVKVTLDLNMCDQGDADKYPGKRCLEDKKFLAAAEQQCKRMNDKKSFPDWVKERTIPEWVAERYQWDNAKRGRRGVVLCSLVKELSGEFPGRPHGHVLDIPEFGKIFLAELLVDCNSFRLVMMRLELGCGTKGGGGIGGGNIEGRTYP
jgi:hypothetical protein